MKNTSVYKFYNNQNELLYVGITNDFYRRISVHKVDKQWFCEIDRIILSEPLTRNTAHTYEIYYIANESPKYNIDFVNGGTVDLTLVDIEFNEINDANLNIKLSKEESTLAYENAKHVLIEYLDSLIGVKVLEQDQVKLKEMIMNECFRINNNNNNGKGLKKMHVKTFNSMMENELNLPYQATATRESKRIGDKVTKSTYWTIQTSQI